MTSSNLKIPSYSQIKNSKFNHNSFKSHFKQTFCTCPQNHSMKNKKEASFSQEPFDMRIPSKRIFHYNQKPILHLLPETLPFQRIKRINASRWEFSLQWNIRERSQRVFKTLGKGTKLDKSLKALSLHFQGAENLRDKGLLHLTRDLKGLKGLQAITFQIEKYHKLTDWGVYHLAKGLARLYFLKSFFFDIHLSDNISDVGLSYIRRSIKKMVLLKDVHLNFSALPEVTDKGMSRLNGSLSRLKRLESVTLIASGQDQVTDRSLMTLRFERLVCLREVYLDFRYCDQLTDKSLNFVAQGLKKLKNLQSIEINFLECPRFTDMGLHYIWEMMNNLHSLQSVELDFSNCFNITNMAFDDMNETLKYLTSSIKEFKFGFYNCLRITDHGVISLCKVLKRAVALQSFCLYFGQDSQITDKGVKEVIDCIKKMACLRNFRIDLLASVNIADVILNEIKLFLRLQTPLEKIILYIHWMGTTSKWKIGFLEKIENLKKQAPYLEINNLTYPNYLRLSLSKGPLMMKQLNM